MNYTEKMSFTETKHDILVQFNAGKNRYDWTVTKNGNILAKGSSVILHEARKMALGAYEIVNKGAVLM